MRLLYSPFESLRRLTLAALLAYSPPAFLRAQQPSLDHRLFDAIGQRDIVSVEHLIRQGANVEARGINGMTPLMEAAEQGNVPLLGLLLESGAKPNAKDNQDETALSWAARGGWVREIDLLVGLSNEADRNHALFEAVRGGPVVLTLDSSAPIHPQIDPSEVVESWTASVESLLAHGAALEARDEDGSTPLLEAAAYAQTETFKLLMQKGARLDARDKYGNTALIAAACQCAVATMNSANELIEILLAAGADVNARNHDGETALMMASGMSGDAYVLELLLRYRADPSSKNHKGMTALAIAKNCRRDDKIAILKRASIP